MKLTTVSYVILSVVALIHYQKKPLSNFHMSVTRAAFLYGGLKWNLKTRAVPPPQAFVAISGACESETSNFAGIWSFLMGFLGKRRIHQIPQLPQLIHLDLYNIISCNIFRKSVPGQCDDYSYSFPLVQKTDSTPSHASLSNETPLSA